MGLIDFAYSLTIIYPPDKYNIIIKYIIVTINEVNEIEIFEF